MVSLLALVTMTVGTTAVPTIHCSPRSAEWLSAPRSPQGRIDPEVLSTVSDTTAPTVALGRGRFRIRVARVHRWDLVAAVQLLKWASRQGGFVLPRLQWHRQREVVGPGRVTFTKADLGKGAWHIALVTRVDGGSEDLVWGRLLTTSSFRFLLQRISGGTLVALFGPNGPAPSQQIEILDESGQVLASGRTGPDGVFLTRNRIRRSALVVAGRGDGRSVALLAPREAPVPCRFLRVWLGSREAGPGDELSLAGLLVGGDPKARFLDVILEEAGDEGTVIGRLQLSGDGLFGGTVRLPPTLVSQTVMLRIARGRCEALAWLRVVAAHGESRPRLRLKPGRAGLEVHLDANRPWMPDLKGRVHLKWGWSRACGREPFAGGSAEACMDGSGKAVVDLSIPEGGRCLWIDALIRDRAGWHRVRTWWPSRWTLPVQEAADGTGWYVARPPGRPDSIHLDDGSSWSCSPGLGFSLCVFRAVDRGVHLVWTKVGSRFLWAWVRRGGPGVGRGDQRGRRLKIRARIEDRMVSIQPGWIRRGGGGLVVLDWEGREVYKVLADVRGSSSVVLDLPRGALGPVHVFVAQVVDGRQVWGTVDVTATPPDVWHLSGGGIVDPSEPLCLEADAPGRFLALLSRFGRDEKMAGPRHRGLLVGAGGDRPSVCLAAPSDSGRAAIRAVGVIAGRLSSFHEDLWVRRPGFRLVGPEWVRSGDRVCLSLSGEVTGPVSYSGHGMSRLGPWPKRLAGGGSFCGLVSSRDPRVEVRDGAGKSSSWRPLVRPLLRGPLDVSLDGNKGSDGWICAGQRCRLVPLLVRAASEPMCDAPALVSSMLARSALREVGSPSATRSWLAGSSRSGPRFVDGAPPWQSRTFGIWMGPEGLLLSQPLGRVATARVQASAVWALVRMGRRRAGASLADAFRYRAWSRKPEGRSWATWSFLETGLPLDRGPLPPGRTVGETAIGLWAAARTGQPLSELDARLLRLDKTLAARRASLSAPGLFSTALALRVVDELLPGHALAGRLAQRLVRGLGEGKGDLLARAAAAVALWDHWDSVLMQSVTMGGRRHGSTIELRCNGAVTPVERGQAIRAVRPMRCPLYRITWTGNFVNRDGGLAWVRSGLTSRRPWIALVIVVRRPLNRPCLRIPLAAKSRLSVLSDQGMGPLPAFPWQVADSSVEEMRVCGPGRLAPGIYGLSFRVHVVAEGRYRVGRACLTDRAGPVACTADRDEVASKEKP